MDNVSPVVMLSADESLLAPPLAKDQNMLALATIAARLSHPDLSALLVYDLDKTAPQMLPYLAEQWNMLGIKGWQFCESDAQKRALLKRAYELNRYKGTPWAIEEVLRVFSHGGTLQEWFEYDGEPFHFKVDVELYQQGLNLAAQQAVADLIEAYKNKRSKLDAINIYLTSRVSLAAVLTTQQGETITVYPPQINDINQTTPWLQAAVMHSAERLSVYPCEANA